MSLSLLNFSQTLVIMTGITLMLVLSVFGIKNNTISVGGFVCNKCLHVTTFSTFEFPWGQFLEKLDSPSLIWKICFNLLNEKNKVEDKGTNNVENKNLEISFKNISFGYHPRQIYHQKSIF